MVKIIANSLIAFAIVGVLTAAPFLVSAHFANADELARGEQTMGPGFTTFLGILAGLFAGLIAAFLAGWLTSRKLRQ